MPASRSRGELFDEMVLDAVEELEGRWQAELSTVEFAVEDVPPVPEPDLEAGVPDPDVVVDETEGGTVPLGRVLRALTGPGVEAAPARLVVYRRPLEVRAVDRTDLAELARDVVVDLIARLLDLDPDDVDPPA